MKHALLVVVALLLLAAPTSAVAQAPPNARLANNPTVEEIVRLGMGYWHARGVYPPDPVTYFADVPVKRAGIGDFCGSQIWLKVAAVAYVQSHPSDFIEADELGLTMVHEMGHNACLTFPNNPSDPVHSPDPASVMSVQGGVVPWVIRRWARNRAETAIARRAARLRQSCGEGRRRVGCVV